MTEKQDVYSRVTNKIIAYLEHGNLTWLQLPPPAQVAGDFFAHLRLAWA